MLGSAEILPHVRILQFCEQDMYTFFCQGLHAHKSRCSSYHLELILMTTLADTALSAQVGNILHRIMAALLGKYGMWSMQVRLLIAVGR